VFTQDSDLNGVFTQDSDLNGVFTQDSDFVVTHDYLFQDTWPPFLKAENKQIMI
jgi:hypothetical protein